MRRKRNRPNKYYKGQDVFDFMQKLYGDFTTDNQKGISEATDDVLEILEVLMDLKENSEITHF